MAHLTPNESLTTLERSLRQLFTVAYTQKFGGDWLTRVASEGEIKILTDRRTEEAQKRERKGVARVPDNLLEYSDLNLLLEIAGRHWEPLAAALDQKKITHSLLHRFNNLRNSTAHSRPLLPFEEDLLAGIAGEIRNRVTIYMNNRIDDNEYWARIEVVVDGFGNEIDGVAATATSNPFVSTGLTLPVGQEVTFDCTGTDPEGRELTWRMVVLPHDNKQGTFEPQVGEHVRFTWTPELHNASSLTAVQITMTADSTSHRFSEGRDGFAGFFYKVVPA